MKISNEKLIPRLTDAIMEMIRNDTLVDNKLPSESALAEKFGVSRNSVRESLKSLETSGFVTRIQGVGTFANTSMSNIKTQLNNLTSTTEIIRNHGFTPGNSYFYLDLRLPPSTIRDELNLSTNEKIIYIERVRTANFEPVVLVKDYIIYTGEIYSNLNKTEELSVYRVLEESGFHISFARCQISAIMSNKELENLLKLKSKHALLYLKQTHCSTANQPIMYSDSFFITEKFNFDFVRNAFV